MRRQGMHEVLITSRAGVPASLIDGNEATITTTLSGLLAMAALYAWDGAALRRLLVESELVANLRTGLYEGTVEIGQGDTPGDAVANPTGILDVLSHHHQWNGATWERRQGNRSSVIESASVVTVTQQGTTRTLRNGIGLRSTLRITAVAGTTPTLDISILSTDVSLSPNSNIRDSAGNNIQFAQHTIAGRDALMICPGVTEKLTGADRYYRLAAPRDYAWYYTIGGTGSPSFTLTQIDTTLGA